MSARDDDWAKAKKLCRLSAEDVRMAKALGLNPRTLVKNIPNPKQRWKVPVCDWVRELYLHKHGPLPKPVSSPAPAAEHGEVEPATLCTEDALFPAELAWVADPHSFEPEPEGEALPFTADFAREIES